MSKHSSSKQETTKSDSSAQEMLQPQNQWALIRRGFYKWKLAVFSLYVIVFLVSISIFAPFIANDMPITYVGKNRFEYKQAYLYLTSQLPKLAVSESANSPQKGKHIKEILQFQIQQMSSCLPNEKALELKEISQKINDVASSSDDKKAAVKNIHSVLEHLFHPQKVQLKTKRYWPLLRSLNGGEVTFMLLNLAFLFLPFYRRISGHFFPKTQWLVAAVLFFAVPVLSGFLWWLSVPERLDRANYKSAVYAHEAERFPKSDIVIETSLWAPIAFGIDEYNLDSINLPPAFISGQSTKSQSLLSREWDTPHWLGTDGIGRDLMTRMIWGGRISLAVGIVAVSIYVTIGIIIGSIAGYFGGMVDLFISRFIEMVIVFPSFFLILTVIAFVGPSIFNIMVIIGLTRWTGVARLVRGEFLRVKAQEFVLAGRALGYSPLRIIYRHILPNAMAPVLVAATFGIAGAILIESGLSFLGLGITIPKPSWGGILSTARTTFDSAPWLTYFPGLAIFITITAYNLVGEAFRDAADPRLRGK